MCIVFLIAREEQVLLFHLCIAVLFKKMIFESSKALVTYLFSLVTELISPDDLLRACSLWEKFNVYVHYNPAHVHVFEVDY